MKRFLILFSYLCGMTGVFAHVNMREVLVQAYNRTRTVILETKEDSVEEVYPDSLLDGSMFQIDDSLLHAYNPKFMLKPLHVPPHVGTYTHTCCLHYTVKDSLSSDYLIIVSENLYDSLQKEIKCYAEDVHTVCSYGVIVESVANPSPEQLKQLILVYQERLKGVLFVGDVGECLYEVENDYNKYGYAKWPCDLFFMDLNGVWSDSDGNGIYDQHTGDVQPEVFVGRLSTVGMSTIHDETEEVRRQLRKYHDYCWESSFHTASTSLNYVDKDWKNSFLPNYVSKVFVPGLVDDIRYGSDSIFSHTDYVQRLSMPQYGFSHLCAHSNPRYHHLTTGYIYASDIKPIASNNYAYNLFCCSACNWLHGRTTNDYLGGAYLFNSGHTLTVIGSSKTGGMLGISHFYNALVAKNVGEAFLKWWKDYLGTGHSQYEIWWNYGMAILGDPTVSFRYNVSDACVEHLLLTDFPADNKSNLIMYKAGSSIRVSGNYVIPTGVHVIFDAPDVVLEKGFLCPRGASFEIRNEGCNL